MACKKPTKNTFIPIPRPTGQGVVIYSFPYYLCDKELVELTISELIKLGKKTGRYGYQVFTLDFGIGSVETITTTEPYTREELEKIYDRISKLTDRYYTEGLPITYYEKKKTHQKLFQDIIDALEGPMLPWLTNMRSVKVTGIERL